MFEINNYKEQLEGLVLVAKQSADSENWVFGTIMHSIFLTFRFVANVNIGELPPFSMKMWLINRVKSFISEENVGNNREMFNFKTISKKKCGNVSENLFAKTLFWSIFTFENSLPFIPFSESAQDKIN